MLLLPEGDEVQEQGDDGRALHDLDQAEVGEVGEERAEDEGGDRHPEEVHHVEEGDDPRAGVLGGAVGGEGEARGLGHVDAEAGHQEREPGQYLAGPVGAEGLVAGEHDQREGHHREAAELPERAEPDIGDALPAERRAVGVGAEAEQRAEGRAEHRKCHHDCDDEGRDAELDDHHPVQGAEHHHRRHADRDLEERQSEELAEREVWRGGVGEGKGPDADPLEQLLSGVEAFHGRSSMACEM